MSRHALSRVLLAAALAALPAVASFAADGIPVKQFIDDADKQFDNMAANHPDHADFIRKNKSYFDEGAKNYLKKDSYQDWEKDYIKDTVNNTLHGMSRKLKMMDQANLERWTAERTQQEMHRLSQETQDKQFKIQDNAKLAAEQQHEHHHEQRDPQNAGKSTGNGGDDDAQTHKDEWQKSDVVKLQDIALGRALKPDPGYPSGGSGGNTGAPDDASGGGSAAGPSGGTGATANGSSGGDSGGASGGTLADQIGELTDKGAAQTLAMAGGSALDQAQYSTAQQDAKSALMLDPANKTALTVEHFAQGRTDGVSTGGPAGKEVNGAGPGVSGSGSSSGGGLSGGAGSFSGGGGSGGGASGALASASLPAGVLSAGGLSAGGAAGGGLSRMSGIQAQKAAQDALGMGDLGGAMQFVNRALAQDPHNPELLALRSKIYAQQRDYGRSAEDAKAGLGLAPKDPALLRSLGFAQLREKDYQGALATANEMLELNPNDPYAYALRAHAYGSMGDRDAMMADLKRAAELDPSFAAAAAEMGNKLQLPEDKDILFLFPGEESASAAKTAAPASGRGRTFGLLVGASAFGGLLLALGLLHTVLAPLKERVTSAFTRLTRTGPTVTATEADASPASVNGLMPGLIRGQYEISRQIGMGGMGMVFAGTDRSLGRAVAIKKMRDELRYDPREKARFVSEAKTVAALHHPNIVDIYAIAEDGDDVYLVFEYVDGKTIHDALQADGKMEPERAARIVRASADALDYAHSRGVIHRDMKPSNVMIDQTGAVKVMDFGIARMAKDTMLRQSMTNTVAGTPPYMAPEQEQGHVRRESDVYSLAICAYEMLCGKLPFAGMGSGMLLNKINMSFVPPSRENAALPAALDPVFVRVFQADPDKRYRTPREFADALQTALPAAVRA
jgi:hypothetical protein